MSDYGRNQYHFDGASLPSLMRQCCATPIIVWDGTPAPTVRQRVRQWLRGLWGTR